MKKITYILTIKIGLLICFQTNLFAQSTVPGNAQGLATEFLGWDAVGIASPLNIKTEQNQPINFYFPA